MNRVIGPMGLTEPALEEFKQIWRRDNPDRSATDDQLYEYAIRTLVAVNLVYDIADVDYPQTPFDLAPKQNENHPPA